MTGCHSPSAKTCRPVWVSSSDGAFITAMVLILLAVFFARLGFAAEAREKRRRKVHQQPRNTASLRSIRSKDVQTEMLDRLKDTEVRV